MNIAGHPIDTGRTLIVAEIGQCHNGSVTTACTMIDEAAKAGVCAVKFQVGDPERWVNRKDWDNLRDTPMGRITEIAYRKRLTLSTEDLHTTKTHAESQGLVWFASALEPGAVAVLEDMGVPCHKVASPMLTDCELLGTLKATGKPIIASTGMSTPEQIDAAIQVLGTENTILMHTTSVYPCPPEQVNLGCMRWLRARFGVPVGYSGHEIGASQICVAAVALGACVIERHMTLSRAFAAQGWSKDHAASLEPSALHQLVRDVRVAEAAFGDGIKRVYDGEAVNMVKFRKGAA